MKVNIFGKCIIKLPDLKKIWYYTGCAKFKPKHKVKPTISSLFWCTLDISNNMLAKWDVYLPEKTEFTNNNWNQSLIVHLFEYDRWSKLCLDIIFDHTEYFTQWSPNTYFHSWIVICYVHFNVCLIWIA